MDAPALSTSTELPPQPVCPLYGVDDRGNPLLIGSAVLLQIADAHFLLTAAHVLDTNARSTLYYGVGGPLQVLEGVAHKSGLSDGTSRDEDRNDVGFMELKPRIAAHLSHGHRFLNVCHLQPNEAVRPSSIYELRGYPETRSKRNPTTKKVRPGPFSYLASPAGTSRYAALHVGPRSHLLLRFERKNSFNETGQRFTAPLPHGMSGGGVWKRRLDSQGDDLLQTGWLVGIAMEYDAQENVIVATRISLFLEAIRARFPGLANEIPKCHTLRVNVSVDRVAG
ncbi:MAG: hypothetical protein PCFJNLEI_01164 [Verrucomicrobiae bacterium]|nr:hypothetical protein [Verrucomicrobiae bacterium]